MALYDAHFILRRHQHSAPRNAADFVEIWHANSFKGPKYEMIAFRVQLFLLRKIPKGGQFIESKEFLRVNSLPLKYGNSVNWHAVVILI